MYRSNDEENVIFHESLIIFNVVMRFGMAACKVQHF